MRKSLLFVIALCMLTIGCESQNIDAMNCSELREYAEYLDGWATAMNSNDDYSLEDIQKLDADRARVCQRQEELSCSLN